MSIESESGHHLAKTPPLNDQPEQLPIRQSRQARIYRGSKEDDETEERSEGE